MTSDPWRKCRVVKGIAAFDIVIATFSIFYSGKTLLAIFGGLTDIEESENWLLVFLILFFTFGIHILQMVFAMILLHGTKKETTDINQAIKICTIWSISSGVFLILLVIELYIGLTTFEYNNYIILFVLFGIFKLFWRMLSIFYVELYKADLKREIESAELEPTITVVESPPVFKMIITTPENQNSDVSDNESLQNNGL